MFSCLGVVVCDFWIVDCELWFVDCDCGGRIRSKRLWYLSVWPRLASRVFMSFYLLLNAKDRSIINIFRKSLLRDLSLHIKRRRWRGRAEKQAHHGREKEGLVFWVGQSSRPLFICRSESNDAFQKLPRENQLERRRRRKKEAEMYTKFYFICCISKYTFVLKIFVKKFFFSCGFEKKKITCIREVIRQPP